MEQQQEQCRLSKVYLEGAYLLAFERTDGLQYVLFSELRSVLLPHVAPSTLQRRKSEVLAASRGGEQHKCPAAYLQLYKQAGLLKPDARQADVLTVQQAVSLLQDLRQRGRVSCAPAVAAASSSAAAGDASVVVSSEPESAEPEPKRPRLLVPYHLSSDDEEESPEELREEEKEEEEEEEEGEEGQATQEPGEPGLELEPDGEREASVQEVVQTITTITDTDTAALGCPSLPCTSPCKARSARLDTLQYPTLRQEIAELCRALTSGGTGGPPMPRGTTASGLAPSTVKKTRERVEGERASSMHAHRPYTIIHIHVHIHLHVHIPVYTCTCTCTMHGNIPPPPPLISHNSLPRLRGIPEATATTRTGGRGQRRHLSSLPGSPAGTRKYTLYVQSTRG